MVIKKAGWFEVPIGEPVLSIRAGRAHTCALGQSGAVFCWGAAPAAPGGNQPKRVVF